MTRHPAIKIAVIGIGLIGPRHAKSVAGCDDAQLLCFVDPSPSAKPVAESFGVPVFPSVEEMLQRGDKPDAAIVCTPNKTHAKISRDLLTAGAHVLVEKPISTTVQDGRDLVDCAKSSGKKLLVGHHRRFNSYIVSSKQALEDGIIGKPIAISGLWVLHKPPSYYLPPTDWRAKRDGGGVIWMNMIHEVDILQYLFGPVIRVHAEQTTSQRGHEAEEGAAILLRFKSGLVASFVIIDASPSAHNFECGTGENPTIPKAGKDFYRIFGTDGTLSVGDMIVTKHASGQEKSWTNRLQEYQIPVGDEVPFDEQVKHLVRVVREEELPRCSGADGLSAMVVCESIRIALVERKSIDIEI